MTRFSRPGERALQLAQLGNLLAVGVGITVLAGWLLDVPPLTYVFTPGPNVKANAGLAMILAGAANELLQLRRGRAAHLCGRVLAIVPALVGGLTLSEHIVGWDLGIDQLLASEPVGVFATTSPSRMGPPASTAFLFIGSALLLDGVRRRSAETASHVLAMLTCIVAVFPIIGYAYGFTPLYAIARYTGIALPTAITLLVLGLAILAARPDRGAMRMLTRADEVGAFVRRLLAATLLLPFGIGALLARSVREGLVDGPFAISAIALIVIITLSAIIWQAGVQLAGALDARLAAERALSASEKSLREVDRQKTEFLATLSHELRNPLAPIRFALALLDGPAERAARARESIARQIAHLTRLIDDLLDLTRITRNKLQLQLRDVELHAVVHDAVDSVTGATGATGHQIELRLPEEPTWLHADHDRLIQVLTNLLGNALRYSHAGSTIVLGAERAGSHVEIYVRDNGIGIAPDDLPRVFDMFVQVGEGSHGGLGIGLALVKGLVDLHGGTIEARSEGIGRGAEFRMRLPRVGAPASRGASPESRRALAPHRILVVDDNRDAADSLGDWLLAHGHTVEVCYTAEDALRCAARLKPDVGLLDIGLPAMTGYDLAKRLRADAPDGRVLLIAITGWGQQDDRERALEAGFDAHLTKPADPGQIIELIAAKSRAATPAL